MDRSTCLQAAQARFDSGDFQAVLARRVACRTESDAGDNRPALQAYLQNELQPELQAMGFEVLLRDNPQPPGGPLLLAQRIEDPGLPTVLTYGHGDVVSGHEGRWAAGRSPWTLDVDGERWYGRGTADNKGQHTVNLMALAEVLRARGGRLGYNVRVLLETGEEAGSPGLRAVCETDRTRLQADLLLACDGPRVQADRPTLFMGSRGAANFSLTVHPRDKGYHSGNWGGVLSNPAVRLAHALASLVDARGAIAVPGLRPPPLDAALRAALAEVPVGGGADDPTLSAGWGEPGLSPAERLYGWNALEVLALHAGQPERPVNAVPPQATAHCQLRFVAGTPVQQLMPLLRTHLDAQGFDDVQLSPGMQCDATRLPVDHPWVRWAADSMQRSAGQRPVLLPNLAGSLPNDLFADLLGMPTLWVPHSYPACAQHAPNEHLLAPIAREGLALMAGLYWDLGEPGAPWHVAGHQVSPAAVAARAPEAGA